MRDDFHARPLALPIARATLYVRPVSDASSSSRRALGGERR
jgi:hypothetical protein